MTQRQGFLEKAFNVYLALVLLFLVRFGIRNARSSENWTIGDWLINYHAGFVRRGLLGELFLRAAQVVPVPAPWLVLTVQLLCYISLLLVFRRLVLGSSRSAWIVALALSPATLSFPLFSALCAYRKEILFFASLAILIYLLLYKRASDSWLSAYLCVALPVIVLSHESIFFYLPYYFAAIFIGLGSWRRSCQLFFVPAVLSFAALLLVTKYPGNLGIAKGVCAAAGYSWQGEFAGPCGGAIFALTYTPEVAHTNLLINIAARPFYWLYPLLTILSLLPVLIGASHLRHFPSLRSRVYLLGATVVYSGCFSMAILYYALDWGRFIYMHAVAAALLILMIEYLKQQDPKISEATKELKLNWSNAPVWALLAIYACCWDLTPTPDIGFRSPPLGVIWLAHTIDKENLARTFLGPLGHHARR